MNQQPGLPTVESREAFFIGLYQKVFPSVAKYISNKGGTLDEAKDVFQDSVVVYYEKLTDGFACANEPAYLMGICKNIWLKRVNATNAVPLDDIMVNTIIEQDVHEPMSDKLMHYLQTSGQKCMNLLKAFYYDKLSVKQIAGTFGYSGERSATVQKYKCLEKVRETVKQQALQYEDFLG